MNPILLIAGAGLALYLWNLTQTGRYILIELTGIRFKDIGINSVTLSLGLRINNPTRQALNLTGLVGEVYINNALLGRMQTSEARTIQAQANTNYPVDLTVGITDSLQIVNTLRKLKGKTVNVRAVGVAQTNLASVPFDVTKSLTFAL